MVLRQRPCCTRSRQYCCKQTRNCAKLLSHRYELHNFTHIGLLSIQASPGISSTNSKTVICYIFRLAKDVMGIAPPCSVQQFFSARFILPKLDFVISIARWALERVQRSRFARERRQPRLVPAVSRLLQDSCVPEPPHQTIVMTADSAESTECCCTNVTQRHRCSSRAHKFGHCVRRLAQRQRGPQHPWVPADLYQAASVYTPSIR